MLAKTHRLSSTLWKALGAFRQDGGQTFAEYSVIVSAIALAATVIAGIAFRQPLTDAWNALF